MAVTIFTRKKEPILINDEDLESVSQYLWYVGKNGYAQNDSKERKLLHRFILKNPAQNIDHINGNKLDNRKENLRLCNQSQNASNAIKKSTNKSGYKGVSWNKKYCKWESYVTYNYKHYFLGYFSDKIQAATAYDKRAKEYFKEFAKTNFDI